MLFYLRKFNKAKLQYLNFNKEFFAIIVIFRKYSHYLKKIKYLIIVKSNYKNLKIFTTSKKLIKDKLNR
jgi:hypothetical protein